MTPQEITEAFDCAGMKDEIVALAASVAGGGHRDRVGAAIGLFFGHRDGGPHSANPVTRRHLYAAIEAVGTIAGWPSYPDIYTHRPGVVASIPHSPDDVGPRWMEVDGDTAYPDLVPITDAPWCHLSPCDLQAPVVRWATRRAAEAAGFTLRPLPGSVTEHPPLPPPMTGAERARRYRERQAAIRPPPPEVAALRAQVAALELKVATARTAGFLRGAP